MAKQQVGMSGKWMAVGLVVLGVLLAVIAMRYRISPVPQVPPTSPVEQRAEPAP